MRRKYYIQIQPICNLRVFYQPKPARHIYLAMHIYLRHIYLARHIYLRHIYLHNPAKPGFAKVRNNPRDVSVTMHDERCKCIIIETA